MESSGLLTLLEQLDDEIDDLEESLALVLNTALAATSSKLPLLDKAKLYILVTYGIESVLFSYLRLNGVKAREHAVFKELTRVKQYFDKIKTAETPAAGRPTATLDKKAAARFIKASLAGNANSDLERLKAQGGEVSRSHKRFKDSIMDEMEGPEKVSAAVSNQSTSSSSDTEDMGKKSTKRVLLPKKRKAADSDPSLSLSHGGSDGGLSKENQKKRKGSKHNSNRAKSKDKKRDNGTTT